MSDDPERVEVIEQTVDVPYEYSYGYDYDRFFEEMRINERILGRTCPRCDTVLVPPRPYCGDCYGRTREWVDVGPTAEVLGYGVVHEEFPGQPTEPPYIYVEVTFEGSDTKVPHVVGGGDVESLRDKVRPGDEVVPVFKDPADRTGNWTDITHFEPK